MENLGNNGGQNSVERQEKIIELEVLKKELEALDQKRSEILSKIIEMDPGFEDPGHSAIEEAYNLLFEQNMDLEGRLTFEGMTGLYSKSYMEKKVFSEMFEEKYEGQENRKTQEGSDSRAILMIDTDKFKNVNDKYGHPVGDEVIKAVAEIVKESVRFQHQDYPSRWGGEETLVLLTEASPFKVVKIAERINENIKNAKILENIFNGGDLLIPEVTVSVGVAIGNKYSNWEELLEKADNALYNSKAGGRDKVSVYDGREDRCVFSNELSIEELRGFES